MNSNRTRYTSTPTFGMQKRSFAKKQAPAPTNAQPDFTQQPAADPSAAVFPGATPFVMQPSAFTQQATPFQAPVNPYGMPMNGNGMPPMNTTQPASGAFPFAQTPYSGFSQQPLSPMTGMPPYGSQLPPLGNSTMPLGNAAQPFGGASPMGMQGFVPPSASPVQPASPMSAPYPSFGAASPSYSPMNQSMPPTGGSQPNAFGAPPTNGAPFANYPSFTPPTKQRPRPPFDFDKWQKIFLFGLLPALFIPCLFVSHTFDFLRYAFIVLAVIGMGVMWYRQSYTSGMRTALSIVYVALSVVVIAMLFSSGNRDVTQTSAAANAQAQIEATDAPAAEPTVDPASVEETPAPDVDPNGTEAQGRLQTFMELWKGNNVAEMVNYVQPSWASTQSDAATALFNVISNRTPLNFTIESIAGDNTDSSRAITMTADIDKNNGKDATRYRFMILMVKENEDWYVDPQSLATNDVEATADPSSTNPTATPAWTTAPRMTVTPVPEGATLLYYNANGGTYYHLDPECSTVDKKYLPLASFQYSEIGNTPYKALQPCLKCGAPTK